jgi:hypothetical protein
MSHEVVDLLLGEFVVFPFIISGHDVVVSKDME